MNDGMKKLSLSTSTRKKSLGENPLEEEEENEINNSIQLPEDKSLLLRNVSCHAILPTILE